MKLPVNLRRGLTSIPSVGFNPVAHLAPLVKRGEANKVRSVYGGRDHA